MGGLRSSKENVIRTTYDIGSLTDTDELRRVMDIAVADTLTLPNSISRNRALSQLANTANRINETSELEQRINALERTLGMRGN